MKTKTNYIMKAIKATDRTFYGDKDVAESAPQDTGDLEFFTLGRYVSDDDLEKEYASRNLTPASILSLCEYDKSHRDILDEKKYVATHWKDSKGNWCFATFSLWDDGERSVRVDRDDYGWDGGWWFAGLRKSALGTSDSQPSSASALSPSELEKAIKLCKDNGLVVYKVM